MKMLKKKLNKILIIALLLFITFTAVLLLLLHRSNTWPFEKNYDLNTHLPIDQNKVGRNLSYPTYICTYSGVKNIMSCVNQEKPLSSCFGSFLRGKKVSDGIDLSKKADDDSCSRSALGCERYHYSFDKDGNYVSYYKDPFC